MAVLSTLAAGRTEALGAAGLSSAEALTGGYRLAFTVGAGLLAAAFVVAALMFRPGPTGGTPAHRDGEAGRPVTRAVPRAVRTGGSARP
ncbi:hypothetical protein [Streptomyces sp. NPDC054995]